METPSALSVNNKYIKMASIVTPVLTAKVVYGA